MKLYHYLITAFVAALVGAICYVHGLQDGQDAAFALPEPPPIFVPIPEDIFATDLVYRGAKQQTTEPVQRAWF
jgi:hypothetical protein